MGLMDKLKEQASQIAEKAQEAGKVGQAKLEALQAKRKADAQLEELGLIFYRARMDRELPGDQHQIDVLIEQLRGYEKEFGALDGAGSPEPPRD